MKKKVFLRFPRNLVTKPVTYMLVKDFDLIVNIFSASVTADEDGILGIEIDGPEVRIKKALSHVRGLGIKVDTTEKRIDIDRKECQDCGVCVSLCPTSALSMGKDFRVALDKEKCIICGQCVDACPFRAIKVKK
jgi:NAD-dependent dihydropyrimidine dehydrogenase PreA subunit